MYKCTCICNNYILRISLFFSVQQNIIYIQTSDRMLYRTGGDAVIVNMNTQHVVRCCSENGDLNWQDNCLSISGVFSQTVVPECYSDRTFTEALEICSV